MASSKSPKAMKTKTYTLDTEQMKALHVLLGRADYVNDPLTKVLLKRLPLDFYPNAIKTYRNYDHFMESPVLDPVP